MLSYALLRLISVERPLISSSLSFGVGWEDINGTVERPDIALQITGMVGSESTPSIGVEVVIPARIAGTLLLNIDRGVNLDCSAATWKAVSGTRGRRVGSQTEPESERHPTYEYGYIIKQRIEPSGEYDEYRISCKAYYQAQRLSYSQFRFFVRREDVAKDVELDGAILTTLPSSEIYVHFPFDQQRPLTVNGSPVQKEEPKGTLLESAIVADWINEELAQRRDLTLIAIGALLGLFGASVIELLRHRNG